MLSTLKRRLYFIVATYFVFWAKFILRRWKPRVVVITGSTGKTTTLHLVEAQLGDKAVYSHHANSSFGIAFQLLGLPPNVSAVWKWPFYVLVAPLRIFRKVPTQKIYIVEADCDRPNEGRFTSRFIKPEVTLWVSVYRTHSMNFDRLVPGQFKTHEQAIAYEFGYFAENASKLVIANSDQPRLVEQLSRARSGAKVMLMSQEAVSKYTLTDMKTVFTINKHDIAVPGLHPKELGNSLQMVKGLLDYLDLSPDPNYKKLVMPPGRSRVFKGKQGTTLIDSTYNTGLGATRAILELFNNYPATRKWAVVGDILEQGSLEAEEHVKLADLISKLKLDGIILLGPRTKKYTYPILKKRMPSSTIVAFEGPKEVLEYLQQNVKGGEVILFRGVRFLEGVVEQMLANPNDAKNLVRRGRKWTKKRRTWGLPK